MSYTLEIIYDSEDAETLDQVQEFLAIIEDCEEKHEEIFIHHFDVHDIDPEERESLEERFGEDLTIPMIVFNDEILFDYYPVEDEFYDAIEMAIENAEFN